MHFSHVTRVEEMRNAYKVLVGNRERNEALGRPRRSWANNSRMDVRKIALEVVDWIHLVQDGTSDGLL